MVSQSLSNCLGAVWLVAACWGVVPAVLVIDQILAIARGWWPAARVELCLTAANVVLLAVIIGVATGAMVRQTTWNWIARRAGKLCLLGVAVWSALALTDVLLHRFGQSLWNQPTNVRPPNLRIVFHPRGDIMPGVSGDACYCTNSDGLRGSEIPPPGAGQRIICLGGSTTECTYLDDAETWPALVAEALNSSDSSKEMHVWVGAAAVSGAGTREHLRFVETSPLMSEIDLLVVLCGVNDLVAALGGGPSPHAVAPWLWSKLALPKLILVTWSRWTAAARLETEDPQGRNYVARRAARAVAPVCETSPSLDTVLAAYGRRLQRIADACRKHHVRLILVEQPVLWSESLPDDFTRLLWLGQLPDGRYLTVSGLREAMDAFNAVTREVAVENAATSVDTSSLMGRPELFYDDCHLNERGARELAALVAKAMAPIAPANAVPVDD
ncbi:MAG: SGNH/GDSL hydrolase family protein [Pirellulales bacterium]|nr:SGNH/GDSL hydrolase family protein [Pirellulales bacterium]